MTFAFKRCRIVWIAATIAGTLGCAPAIRVGEPVAHADASASFAASSVSLATDAIADLASHGDLLVPPATDTAFTAGSSDGLRTIDRGIYAGMRVPVRIEAALGGANKSEHFWRAPKSGAEKAGVVGWRSTRYPIPVAFRHSGSSREISADDSAAFWRTLAEMSADVGLALFKPVTVGDADPVDVIIVDVRPMPGNDGFSRASWSSSGELFDVRVSFGSLSVLHVSQVVAHEMTHALGFGHTKSWVSVVNPGDHRTARLTPADVAYIEMAMRLRERRERADMRQLIALAVERGTPGVTRREGYATCAADGSDLFTDEVSMRNRDLLPVGVLTVVSACTVVKRQE